MNQWDSKGAERDMELALKEGHLMEILISER